MDKKLQERVASMFKSDDRTALAEMLVEVIKPNHLTGDMVSLFLKTRALNPGDSLVKKIRKGIDVRTLVPGSIHLASEITVEDRITYVLDGADVKVTFNEWDIENGDIGTVQEIRDEMAAKLSDYYINKVFTALSTVWTASNTPDNYTEVATAVTQTAVKNAIDRINQTTPGVKAVVGVRSALTPITDWGSFWYSGTASTYYRVPENISEIMATGWLGNYYGAPIVALDQIWDNPQDYNALLPTDKILVIGENAGEFITFGDVKKKEWTDMAPTPPQWYFEIYQQFGMIIDNAQGIYVIKIT